ncbi:HPP family protein [Neisseriaceae bacterium CLB008]
MLTHIWRMLRAQLKPAASASPSLKKVVLVGAGVFLGLAVVAFLAVLSGQPWLLGSFGASCVLLFGFPNVPFSQPRNVIGGHMLSSALGLAFLWLLGPSWWALAAAGAAAAMLMLYTQTVHPPAGSNPVIVFLSDPGWGFLWLPTLFGAILLVLLAKAYAVLLRRWAPAVVG